MERISWYPLFSSLWKLRGGCNGNCGDADDVTESARRAAGITASTSLGAGSQKTGVLMERTLVKFWLN